MFVINYNFDVKNKMHVTLFLEYLPSKSYTSSNNWFIVVINRKKKKCFDHIQSSDGWPNFAIFEPINRQQ